MLSLRADSMSQKDRAHAKPSLLRSLCNSASAAAIAEGLTLPLDTAKVRHDRLCPSEIPLRMQCTSCKDKQGIACGAQVRLQLQNFSHDPVPRYTGPLQTVGRIMKDEGASAAFKVRLFRQRCLQQLIPVALAVTVCSKLEMKHEQSLSVVALNLGVSCCACEYF